MSLHKSFTGKAGAGRHRNVLSRAERVLRLQEEDRWKEDGDVFGLPKVRNIKPRKKAKAAKAKTEKVSAAAAPEAATAPAKEKPKK